MNFWRSCTGWWVVCCALFGGAGWVLSAMHQLNRAGYVVVVAGLAVSFIIWKKHSTALARPTRTEWRKFHAAWRRRRSRLLPVAFALFSLLILFSGLLYPSNNYDGLAYRLPRLLNWLAEGQWHWIDSVEPRLNNRACGFEWNLAPWLALTGTDRATFLLNTISFLLLPGLVFSVCSRLGTRRRVAWTWMWLLPTSYGFLLQAGGSSNDVFSVPLALAAVDFALRFRESRQMHEAWISLLATGVMTSIKATNLVLVLPWAAALLPSWRPLCSKWIATALVAAWAALASFLPSAVMNHRHYGDWTGANAEKTAPRPSIPGAIAGNTFLVLEQNLIPTVFPGATWWNAHVQDMMPAWLNRTFEKEFEGRAWLAMEIPIEEWAGLGWGVSVSLALPLGWFAWRRVRSGRATGHNSSGRHFLVRLAPWFSLLAYMAKVSISTTSRVLLPFYPLLLPSLLTSPRWDAVVRSPMWRRWMGVVIGLALFTLVVNPARPLWPAQTILPVLIRAWPDQLWLGRALDAYRTYAQRHDALAPMRAVLPESAREVGFVTGGDDPEASLWRPFGSRRIHQLKPAQPVEAWRARGIQYVILTPNGLKHSFRMNLAEWLDHHHAEVAARVQLHFRASGTPHQWVLARLRGGEEDGGRQPLDKVPPPGDSPRPQ